MNLRSKKDYFDHTILRVRFIEIEEHQCYPRFDSTENV